MALAATAEEIYSMAVHRRLPIGAEVSGGGVHFRVWAPAAKRVAAVIEGSRHELGAESDGYFSGLVSGVAAGARYGFAIDDDPKLYPDPASRFQPDGPHGLSAVVDPSAWEWRDNDWEGVPETAHVVYEMHVGTFTEAGTWRSATEELPRLADLGITIVEVMPVAAFPGSFGWGYDGVDLFAPAHLYGTPDELRAFVDAAHARGVAVILDVVYNHFGPSGNYLHRFSHDYFTDRYENEWGDAINFDGPRSKPVRELFVANAGYWIDEFHMDGLRLDATQSINDASKDHIVAEVARQVRTAAKGRRTWIVAENEPQHVRLIEPQDAGGYGLDAMWNDDYHHTATVALTGRREAYYTDYGGTPQELISAAKWGFLYQGQWYTWQKQKRGTVSLGVSAKQMVVCLENHDQVANSAYGARLATVVSPALLRAMTTFLLLGPPTPMLFQGQEFGSTRPFTYFADHEPELAKLVATGRREFLEQFPSIASREMNDRLAPPHDRATFERSKLDPAERDGNRQAVALHRDLIRLRQSDPTYAAQRNDLVHGAVLSTEAFLLRWICGGTGDRLLVINLGCDLACSPSPEPLLVPPPGCRWELAFSSESPEYGGSGTPPVQAGENWSVPGRAALAFRAVPVEEEE